ncbi:MAG: hypothetical protein PHR19_01685 [Bacteroidales bacterium]|nr:hypothetical protein [Bacteroidales bacterium]
MFKLRFLLFISIISYLPFVYSQKYSTGLTDHEIDKINELVIKDFIEKSSQPDSLYFNIIPAQWDFVLGNPNPIDIDPNYIVGIQEFEIDSLLHPYFCGYKYIIKDKLNYQNKFELLNQVINLNDLNFTWNYPENIPITENMKQFRSLSLTQPYCIEDKFIIIGFYLYNGFRFERSGILFLINNGEWSIDKKCGCWMS